MEAVEKRYKWSRHAGKPATWTSCQVSFSFSHLICVMDNYDKNPNIYFLRLTIKFILSFIKFLKKKSHLYFVFNLKTLRSIVYTLSYLLFTWLINLLKFSTLLHLDCWSNLGFWTFQVMVSPILNCKTSLIILFFNQSEWVFYFRSLEVWFYMNGPSKCPA